MHSEEFKDLASSFPGSISQPHFDRIAFKVDGKRIFATLHEKSKLANILLSPPEQQLFCHAYKNLFPVPNKWGNHGWTTFEIEKLERAVVLEALRSAYEYVLRKDPNNKSR